LDVSFEVFRGQFGDIEQVTGSGAASPGSREEVAERQCAGVPDRLNLRGSNESSIENPIHEQADQDGGLDDDHCGGSES
jgi:hypothetical protein